jgi:tetratricopeptide (TPR) repeat protein
MRWTSLLAISILIASTTALAQTEPDPDTMTADERYEFALQLTGEAVEAFGTGQYADAIDLFHRAYEYEADPVLLFNVGRCQHQAGNLPEAVDAYYVALETGDLDDETGTRAEGYIDEILESEVTPGMRSQIDQLTRDALTAVGEGDHEGAAAFYRQAYDVPASPHFSDPELLILQGESLVEAETDLQTAIDAFDAALASHGVSSAQGRRAEDGKRSAEQLIALAAVGVEPPVVVPDPGGGGGTATIGFIVAGLGAATVIGGLLIDSGLSATIDDYETAAANGEQDNFDTLAEDINSGQSTALLLYAAGGVLVAGGLVLILIDDGGGSDGGSADTAEGLSATAVPVFYPSGAGFQLDWRF